MNKNMCSAFLVVVFSSASLFCMKGPEVPPVVSPTAMTVMPSSLKDAARAAFATGSVVGGVLFFKQGGRLPLGTFVFSGVGTHMLTMSENPWLHEKTQEMAAWFSAASDESSKPPKGPKDPKGELARYWP